MKVCTYLFYYLLNVLNICLLFLWDGIVYKIKTNECLNDEYHVTQPINNSLSISVRRFYKSVS